MFRAFTAQNYFKNEISKLLNQNYLLKSLVDVCKKNELVVKWRYYFGIVNMVSALSDVLLLIFIVIAQ